jgi:hypothetical protein
MIREQRMPSTLAEAFAADVVDPRQVEQQFGPEAALGRSVIGVNAHAFELLGICPPMMRHYAMLVSVFLRMPRLVWIGYRLRHVVPLVMLASSVGADCRYCTGHSCLVALGRGVNGETIAEMVRRNGGIGAVMRDTNPWSNAAGEERRLRVSSVPPEAVQAAYEAGLALGRLPSTYTARHRRELEKWFSGREIEAIVLAASLMGWLNKMMDGSGVTLEADVVGHSDTILGPSGWDPRQHLVDEVSAGWRPRRIHRDRLWTIPSLLLPAGRATKRTTAWMKGVPIGENTDAGKAALARYLQDRVGYAWPVLGLLEDRTAAAAMATLIVDVLGARPQRYPPLVSVGVKAELWRAYARAAGLGHSPEVEAQVSGLRRPGGQYALPRTAPQAMTEVDEAAYALGLGAVRSPAEITPGDVAQAEQFGPQVALEVLETIAVVQTAARLCRGLAVGNPAANPPAP